MRLATNIDLTLYISGKPGRLAAAAGRSASYIRDIRLEVHCIYSGHEGRGSVHILGTWS